MLNGPDALRSLDEALRDIRREEDEIARKLARSAERITKIRETEGELLRELAKVRLDPATQAELAGRLSQTELRARQMLLKHGEALSAAEAELQEVDRTIADLTAERAAALAEIDKSQAALKALSARIGAAISRDPDYERQQKAAVGLKAIAAEALAKTAQADADREQKGRPYREDPLFSYLWNNRYGTSTYKAGRLSATLDAWVARLIGFHQARPNYAMLNEIPLRLRQHAEQQAQHAAAADEGIDKLESAAVDAAGGQPVREALAAAQAQIVEIDQKIVTAQDLRDEKTRLQTQLAQGSDPAFEDALSALAQGLGREDIRTLVAEARLTHTGQDDTIVAQIDEARRRAMEEGTDTNEQNARLKTLAARRRELEDIQYEFKKSRFDDPRSTFREDNLVGGLLDDFLKGSITAASYWNSWRGSQNWSAGSSDWGGGIGLPRNGRNSGPTYVPDPWANGAPPRPGNSAGQQPSSGWGAPQSGWGNSGATFSRPRSGSQGTRSSGSFKTGGGF